MKHFLFRILPLVAASLFLAALPVFAQTPTPAATSTPVPAPKSDAVDKKIKQHTVEGLPKFSASVDTSNFVRSMQGSPFASLASMPGGARRSFLRGAIESVVSIAIIFGLPVFIVAIAAFARHRRTQALHQTLRLMVEKGVAIPPELLLSQKQAPNDFRRGVLLIAIGAGLIAFLAVNQSGKGTWSVGLVPLLLGVGYLVVAQLGTKPPTDAGSTLPS